ncbi:MULTISPECIES: Xaa-Pro peptidase family protein [unclassified Staphylococcus]|uniref:M24 family metallopeptidase n=1 Tax=unclassified Staphylococcus TaxID=91994 RepID=UPI0018826E23|nr:MULTISPECIES: Xaa-Pro peptidase family protein [unclassified Staphylococcus]MBF2757675.1 aminopeptidase P family protein [Staphylococcus haemolyticus]MBF2773292.1 aminopeptidase P family protein [Staphylococcus haemolyticus]MBF2776871.1 aminopeptidase P family protein [Staphylococcus haemolyticus]MBF2815125.1 aminopeptidase P family protein [Staphylococcus haemolyticus]MBF9720697.1 aminopeptidase P family protein [Staphylococcus haemolyticus]
MSKIETIIEQLNQAKADAAWITTPLNVFYFTGYRSEPHERLFALLITSDGSQTLYCPKMEVEEVKRSSFDGKIIGYLDTENPFDIEPRAFNKLLIESEHLTVKRQRELTQNFGVQHYGDIDQTIKDLRNIKNDSEIQNIREAAKLADKCIEIGTAFLKVGVTEREVVNHIENEIKKYGVSEMSFDTMVLFGDHAASPHGTPGDRKLVNDEYVLFDLGVIYNHYCSDMTRTVKFGTPSEEAQTIYKIVLEAETSAIKAIKAGVPLQDIDQIARDIISNAGYGEYFPHRLGHGLGLEEHEYQDVSSSNTNLLEAGMVITIEPGIYVPNVAGVRIEDDILVTEDGYEILTHYDK